MTGVIERYGVLGVFLLMIPESACIPLPSELTLLFSGFAVHQGWMSFPLAVLAATAGNLVGSLLAHGLGATHLLQRLPALARSSAAGPRCSSGTAPARSSSPAFAPGTFVARPAQPQALSRRTQTTT